jgi:general secretion pathway protein I
MTKFNCKGFSLLEVLVAFTVLALSLGAIFPLFASVSNSARLSESYGQALMIAESRMAVLSAETPLQYRDQLGQDGQFIWHEKVSDYDTGELSLSSLPTVAYMLPRQLDVHVSWVDGSHERAVTLSSVRLSSDAQ